MAALKIQSAWRASATPTALPTNEALQILLSPDGYYNYLGISRTVPDDIIGDQVNRKHRILSLDNQVYVMNTIYASTFRPNNNNNDTSLPIGGADGCIDLDSPENKGFQERRLIY